MNILNLAVSNSKVPVDSQRGTDLLKYTSRMRQAAAMHAHQLLNVSEFNWIDGATIQWRLSKRALS